MSTFTLKARWLISPELPPVENGKVVVDSGRIAQAGADVRPCGQVIDVGDAVLMPGLVNAHTHLELSNLAGKVPYEGSFTAWIERLVAASMTDVFYASAMEEGLRQSLRGGVTAVADIGVGPSAVEQWREFPIHTCGFLEVLGMSGVRTRPRDRSVETAAKLLQDFSSAKDISAQVLRQPGISPHAPYSADGHVYKQAAELAQQQNRPLCTHLAESREELEFLSTATGPFREFLEKYGLWDGSFEPPGCSPVAYMHRLGVLACHPLLVHVNYASDADLDLLARYSCHVVYCPRSHYFFGHDPHGFREMMGRRINVCVGTDSLASNDSLSVLDELRFLRKAYPQISGETLLSMGTLSGARALGWEEQIGSLTTGKRADMLVVPLAQAGTADPLGDVLGGTEAVRTVYRGGEVFYTSEN